VGDIDDTGSYPGGIHVSINGNATKPTRRQPAHLATPKSSPLK